MFTAYHAKYFAQALTLRHAADGVDRLSQSLFDASVDLNPHNASHRPSRVGGNPASTTATAQLDTRLRGYDGNYIFPIFQHSLFPHQP